jgi:4-hydroxyphenylacetate 3-monooxygenase
MTAAVKTGAEHVQSLRDGRQVFIDGERVEDVTTHPAFHHAVRSAAALYDYQAAPEHIEHMTFVSPINGKRVNRAWWMPTSYAEMVQRREAMVAWLRLHGGFMGRSPDHLASALVGQAMGIEVFERYDKACARALQDYFTYARDHDLFLTYVIINPQADRSKAWGEQEDEFLVAGVVDEDSQGITVRGAKMLGTSSIMANEVLVANLQPLRPGEERYALSFALPMNAPGLKVLSRKSFEASATSAYDYPLATHFDENDALMYFDDVKVPWERVFVYRNTDMCRAQFHDTAGHMYQNYQAQIRLSVKLQFLVGIALMLTETIGTRFIPQVNEVLGQLAAQAAMVEGMVYGMEAAGGFYRKYYVPKKHLMYAAQVLTQELYPTYLRTLRELAGGSLIMLPSSARDFAHPELKTIIEKTQRSPAMTPEARVKFLKLAWDAIGSEFASRHLQYEMFYAGAQFVTKGHSVRTYDWDHARHLVQSMLDRYHLQDTLEAFDHPQTTVG